MEWNSVNVGGEGLRIWHQLINMVLSWKRKSWKRKQAGEEWEQQMGHTDIFGMFWEHYGLKRISPTCLGSQWLSVRKCIPVFNLGSGRHLPLSPLQNYGWGFHSPSFLISKMGTVCFLSWDLTEWHMNQPIWWVGVLILSSVKKGDFTATRGGTRVTSVCHSGATLVTRVTSVHIFVRTK